MRPTGQAERDPAVTAHSIDWTTPAIRIAAAGVGGAVAGPLGAALGGLLGDALGSSATALIKDYAERFGEKAAEKLLDSGTDSFIEKLKIPPPEIESVYREALRLSLAKIHLQIRSTDFDDWFTNWNRSLTAPEPLDLSSIEPSQFSVRKLDDLFRHTLERIDEQGAAIQRNDLSLTMRTRTMPEALISELTARLPISLQETFRSLIVTSRYELAWKQTQLVFQQFTGLALGRIDERTQRIERIVDELGKRSPAINVSGTPAPIRDDAWVLKIDEDGHLVQSDEQIALIFSEMLVAASPSDKFHVAVDKQAMVNAIRLTRAQRAVADFWALYESIADSRELAALIARLDPISSLTVAQRKTRVDAMKVAKLWEPIEAGINAGLLCFRNAIGKYHWLSTTADAADGSRAFINLYFEHYLGHAPLLTGTKIDVWRDREPMMQTSVDLTDEETAHLEASLGFPVAVVLMLQYHGFTASEFSAPILRRKFVPRLIYEAVLSNIPIHESATSDLLFRLDLWNIGLG